MKLDVKEWSRNAKHDVERLIMAFNGREWGDDIALNSGEWSTTFEKVFGDRLIMA